MTKEYGAGDTIEITDSNQEGLSFDDLEGASLKNSFKVEVYRTVNYLELYHIVLKQITIELKYKD